MKLKQFFFLAILTAFSQLAMAQVKTFSVGGETINT